MVAGGLYLQLFFTCFPGGLEVEETFFQENSSVSDEGLDLSQRISESLFIGPDMDTDAELVAGRFHWRELNTFYTHTFIFKLQ